MIRANTAEHRRLLASEKREADWKNFGPYLAERAWGTVREDYSANGEAWDYFPHDHARSRAYRWNEDGLGGFCNRFQNICLAVALWNERDVMLKERLFGLSGSEGNHGEDVKELYWYLDGVPSHAYMKMLYKYPQVAFPYEELVHENRRRGRGQPEYELIDALRDTFAAGRYFDVFIEYAKADEDDLLCRITAVNRGPDEAALHVLPHLWFRNVWSWQERSHRPELYASGPDRVTVAHYRLGERFLAVMASDGQTPRLLFTENETNSERLYGVASATPYVKDSIHEAVVRRRPERVNPAQRGTKVAAQLQRRLAPGETFTVTLRFAPKLPEQPFAEADALFATREAEADAFYDALHRADLTEDERRVQRQALAGLLWSKQFYHYSVELWLEGDPAQPAPPSGRSEGRNADWAHMYCLDVLSMPDAWEYPWFAAWDLAFHAVPLALVDPEWAKRQLVLMLREWYMHPNGQVPAYEWAFGDVNPPVHAWAALRVYELEKRLWGRPGDTEFLEKVFHKLLLNFTWWVNQRDADGNNVFQGGFLGLDNIGVFDRSQPLPTGGHLEQADGTAWMAVYSLNLLRIALELARDKPAYEDVATKFFEHFVYIAHAFYHMGHGDTQLWDDADGFFYDLLHDRDGNLFPLRIRSFVGLIPLFAVERLDVETLERLPRFRRRVEWFLRYRPELVEPLACLRDWRDGRARYLSVVGPDRLERVLQRALDPAEFLAEHGLRALSRHHLDDPYVFWVDGHAHEVRYEPAESSSGLFGGNSNWRGPIWLPVNYLLIESLYTYGQVLGDQFRVECPVGSGQRLDLTEVADELGRRLAGLFTRGSDGRRPVFGREPVFQNDPHFRDYVWFYEYFDGDTGAGLGASHQTGWTALVASLLQELGARGVLEGGE